jgi:hypothetical protein
MKSLTTHSAANVFLLTLGVVIAFLANGAIAMTPKVHGVKNHGTVGPVLYIKNRVYNFGLAVDGEEVIHDFMVQNLGSSTLEIEEVKTD